MSDTPAITAQHLILGMSHAGAIWHGHRAAGLPDEFLVIPLTGKRAPTATDVIDGKIEGVPTSQVRSLFLALYGNAHNSFAMMERSPPIWTKTAFGQRVPEDRSGRKRMSRALIRKQLSRALTPMKLEYALYRANYPDAAIFAISTPPPLFDAAHIREFPSGFADKLVQGIAPASLRLAIYSIQIEIIGEMAAGEGITLIPVPPEAVNEAGGLAQAYWNPDPTHGNTEYGKLVFEQIRAAVAQLAD